MIGWLNDFTEKEIVYILVGVWSVFETMLVVIMCAFARLHEAQTKWINYEYVE